MVTQSFRVKQQASGSCQYQFIFLTFEKDQKNCFQKEEGEPGQDPDQSWVVVRLMPVVYRVQGELP